MTNNPAPLQEKIVAAITERGPMRAVDIARSIGKVNDNGVLPPLGALVEKGILVKEFPFYRLPDQQIPAAIMAATRPAIVQLDRSLVSRVRLEEREAMKKELLAIRDVLIETKSLLTKVIDALTPEDLRD